MKKARHTSVIWLRRLLAGGFVVFALAVAALYWFGRVQRAGFGRAEEAGEPGRPVSPGTVGETFDFQLTEQGRRVFGVRAARIVSRRADDFLLEGVELSVEREGGGTYQVTSERATYSAKTNHAVLEGKVVIEGPNRVTLRTAGLEMRRRGRYLMSTGPVTFQFGQGYAGRARSLEANFRSDEFLLAGKVEVRSQPGVAPALSLDCRRVSYQREPRLLVAEGDVVLTRGADRLLAGRLELQLAPDERTPQRLDALWDVRVAAVQPGSDGLPHALAAEGHEVHLTFTAEGEPAHADLAAGPHPFARLSAEEAGIVRSLVATNVAADFAAGDLVSLAGDGGVTLEEFVALPPQLPLREVCGETLRMTMASSGAIDTLVIDGGVDFTEPWTQGRTPRMALDERSDELVLEGPGTWIARDGVRVAAPRILVAREGGSVRALDGVRADMEREQGLALASREAGDEPLHVVAEQATWTREGGFQFEQSVRAWQGPNYLLANTLGGDGERFTATGPVKTVLETAAGAAEEGGDAAEQGDGPAEEEGEREAGPLEITAQELHYERPQRLLVYQGSPRARQGKATLACTEIRGHLDAEDELELLECTGPVQIDDPESGNKVYGQAAEYRPGLDRVRVTGDPVRLVDRQGGQFQGRAMYYDFTTGKVELESRAGGAEDPFGPVPEPPPPPEPPVPPAEDEEPPPGEEDGSAAPPWGRR